MTHRTPIVSVLMMFMSSAEIRKAFLDFFAKRGHRIVPSSPLIPAGDPSLLFTNAGMVQFKDSFLGLEKRSYNRATTAQKCMRVSGKHNDFENVGPSLKHHTFFEMLGNFSFGDYFKREQIHFGFELFTQVFGLPLERLIFTVHQDDELSYKVWTDELGISPDRVLRMGDATNSWSMGDTGPCGPTSEVHYDWGIESDTCHDPNCSVALDNGCERWLEVANFVFMQYDQRSDGTRPDLPRPGVDTGTGLERLASVLQNKTSNYDTDLFQPIIARTRQLLNQSPEDYDNEKRAVSYRVIADHARAVTFLIADGVNPSNDGRGYVTRLILRRAARHGHLLGFGEPFLADVIPTVIELMRAAYPEVEKRREHIIRVTREEEDKFLQTLRVGSEILDDIVADLRARGAWEIPGEEAFRLYDTFGFPLDLTREVARENGMTVEEPGFRAALEEASERSRSASGLGKLDDSAMRVARSVLDHLRAQGQLPERGVTYEPYSATSVDTKLVGILRGDELVETLAAGERAEMILAESCFYVESGGQVSDIGRIAQIKGSANESGAWEFRVDDVRLPVPGLLVHVGQMINGEARLDDRVLAEVDGARRLDIMRNHTATHLLHAELRRVLGEHVQQAGSLVAPDHLRFDFTHNRPVAPDELARIEDGVNQAISQDFSVQPHFMPYKEALGKGAMALFTEKYGDVVRMMEINGISRELCGGTHVSQTGEIGLFHIVSESSVGAGARRIEALTGHYAYEEFQKAMRTVQRVGERLRVSPAEVEPKVGTLLEQLEDKDKEIARLHRELAKRQAQDVNQVVRDIGGVNVISHQVQVPSMELLREQSDFFRNKIGSGVVAVGAIINGKPAVVVSVTGDLVERGFSAREISAAAAKRMGGGGGGKAALAQAGGREPEMLGDALNSVFEIVDEEVKRKSA
jgi:alanyl-tRNA synthetase